MPINGKRPARPTSIGSAEQVLIKQQKFRICKRALFDYDNLQISVAAYDTDAHGVFLSEKVQID
jgi:hypothetical protein